MEYPIDNFQVAESQLLSFCNPGEFYMAMVLKRRKDVNGPVIEGVNEDNRLIKHYFIYDAEYLNKKKQAIINLCEQNNARAYLLPQRRDCRLVLWALHDKVSETLRCGSMNVHFDHLIRSCVAGMHETAEGWHKRWVIDIDADDEATKKLALEWKERHFNPTPESFIVREYAEWVAYKIRCALVSKDGGRYEDAVKFMPKVKFKYSAEDITVLHTPHGFHVVTPPFNRRPDAMEEYFGVGTPSNMWIKPDSMALLYSPSTI